MLRNIYYSLCEPVSLPQIQRASRQTIGDHLLYLGWRGNSIPKVIFVLIRYNQALIEFGEYDYLSKFVSKNIFKQ